MQPARSYIFLIEFAVTWAFCQCNIPAMHRFIRQCHVTCLLGMFALAQVGRAAEDYFPPPDTAGGWRAAIELSQAMTVGGVNTQKLDMAFDYASRTSQHGGLLVVRHGYLVYEKY